MEKGVKLKTKHFMSYFIGKDKEQTLLFLPKEELAAQSLAREVKNNTLQKISIESSQAGVHIYFEGKERIYVITNFQVHPGFYKDFAEDKKQIPMLLFTKNFPAEYVLTLNG